METDRTSILTYQQCPRKRWYSRHFNGTGIERKSKSLPLAFGSAFHTGTEYLLDENCGSIEIAVNNATGYLNGAFAKSAVDLEGDKQTEYLVNEQKAIAEALLRAWWIYDGQRFLDEFEVIEVEQEGRANLTDDIVLMFRPDALVREKSTGDLYIVSWKTCSKFSQMTQNQCNTDMQSMSEVWGVQQAGEISDPKIEGVLYIFAVKGQRKMDDYLGFKRQDTPLVYGWRRQGTTPEDDEWCWKYEYETGETNPRTGKQVRTKLGKGWQRVSIWDNYPGGVKAWIEALHAQEITPRHISCLESVFPKSMPVSRRADEIDSWQTQMIGQESKIKRKLDTQELALEVGSEGDWLDLNFRQHTSRCFDWASKCSFYDACFVPSVKADPMASGLYQIRQANHPEKEDINED